MSTTLELPARMAGLRRTSSGGHGYPVPWFVADVDGKPDFRIMDPEKLVRAVRNHLCWVCGQPMGSWSAFLIGPMCAVNRVSAEPPSHRECAVYSAMVCPFLTTPKKVRRESNLPEHEEPAGIMIARNPGVALVWIVRSNGWHTTRDESGGVLFDIGNAAETLWFAEGREATREEVLASIRTGRPILWEMAEKEGPEAVSALSLMMYEALLLVPKS